MESRRGFLKLLGLGGAGAAASLVAPTPVQAESCRSLIYVGEFDGEILEFEVEPPPSVFINRKKYYAYEMRHFTCGMLSSLKPLYEGLEGDWIDLWKNELVIDTRNQEVLTPKDWWKWVPKPAWASQADLEAVDEVLRRWHHMRAAGENVKFMGDHELRGAVFTNPQLNKLAYRYDRRRQNKT